MCFKEIRDYIGSHKFKSEFIQVLRFQKLYLHFSLMYQDIWFSSSASHRVQAKTITLLRNLDKMFNSSIFIIHYYTNNS